MYPSFRAALEKKPQPLIGAHRGASRQFPENSLAAFSAAILQGADFLELDVRLSRDGIPVVIHDSTVDRTTGHSGQVGELTAARLVQYGIPLLDTVLALGSEKVLFNIELKPDSRPESLVRLVLDLIGSHRLELQVLLSSFDQIALQLIKKRNSSILTGLLYEDRLPDPAALARRLQADALHPHFRLMNRRLTALMQAQGLYVIPWTVDRPSAWFYFRKIGANGVITNFPAEAVLAYSFPPYSQA
ncbi:MAG: glycerophosphodiester phosphodiesterase family protein [Negativicutes bacterium]|nr:glycerophosphodiester phosphodiesterase family protein [Negativicutes bacterium]